ncbi:MAG: CvpA family protein [Sedimentisphaerales bacterium]|nr:CvpA family protein [Sedimentisphaerales bacterium]
MIAIVILCALTLLLVYYQALKEGLFSSMIMAVESVVAAIVALNFYEPLGSVLNNFSALLGKMGPQGISMLGVFVLTLVLLRLLTDRIVKGNMIFPDMMNKAGGAVFSFISAMTITGMMALAIQSMPVSAVFLGFDRYGEQLDAPEAGRQLWPGGDRLLLAMMKQVSTHCFAGQNSFAQQHPDMLYEMYLNRVVPADQEGSRKEAGADVLDVRGAWVLDREFREAPLQSGEQYIVVKVYITRGSGERGDRGSVDSDGAVRFGRGHFRLVGYNPAEHNSPGTSQYPIGIIEPDGSGLELLSFTEGQYFASGRSPEVDLLFKWPKSVPPQYIEFKRSARAGVRIGSESVESEQPSDNQPPERQERFR